MSPIPLQISLLPGRYSVCRLAPNAAVPALSGAFFSVTRTAVELSIVCAEAQAPAGARCEPGWRVLRLEGPFAFDQVGVLLAVLAPLGEAGVSIFALSTFDTDFILVKETALSRARTALEGAGHALKALQE